MRSFTGQQYDDDCNCSKTGSKFNFESREAAAFDANWLLLEHWLSIFHSLWTSIVGTLILNDSSAVVSSASGVGASSVADCAYS
jgi:hypothetical protein